jgi:hypothetical protein
MPLMACLLSAHCCTASGTAWSWWHFMQAWLWLETEAASLAIDAGVAAAICGHPAEANVSI